MTDEQLRVAVVGAGIMGTDHIERLATRTKGAVVAAIVEPDESRAAAAAALAPGAALHPRIEDALDDGGIDAVLIATPGPFHTAVLLPALEAGLAVLCEKPLAPTADEALEVLEAEQRLPAPRIQVGFMRRFDAEYAALESLARSGDAGELLLLHCAHRNPSVADAYTESMTITDSVVHELDVVPWLAGAGIGAIEVRSGRRNRASRFADPQLVLLELTNGVLADVEISVNAGFGYQVTTEAVFERGVAGIGRAGGLVLAQDGRIGVAEHRSYTTRFAAAYDTEVQRWVDAARLGGIDGPSAWEGYRVAVASAAGVEAQRSGRRVELAAATAPPFYRDAHRP
jgi:myo-inositol 2-dehydrogenase / D-chiro-inositol 1-dehydrogenase